MIRHNSYHSAPKTNSLILSCNGSTIICRTASFSLGSSHNLNPSNQNTTPHQANTHGMCIEVHAPESSVVLLWNAAVACGSPLAIVHALTHRPCTEGEVLDELAATSAGCDVLQVVSEIGVEILAVCRLNERAVFRPQVRSGTQCYPTLLPGLHGRSHFRRSAS